MNYLQKNIYELCLTIPGARHEDGGLNVAFAARQIGIPQPTLKRILDGGQSQIRPATEKKIANFFHVRPADLYATTRTSKFSDNEVKEIVRAI